MEFMFVHRLDFLAAVQQEPAEVKLGEVGGWGGRVPFVNGNCQYCLSSTSVKISYYFNKVKWDIYQYR